MAGDEDRALNNMLRGGGRGRPVDGAGRRREGVCQAGPSDCPCWVCN